LIPINFLIGQGNNNYSISNPHEGIYSDSLDYKISFIEELCIIQTDTNINYQFHRLSSIDTDYYGNIYVLDNGNNKIQKYDSTGKYITTIGKRGKGPGELEGARSLLVLNNHLFVSDLSNVRITIFDLIGNFIKQIKETIFSPLMLTGQMYHRNVNTFYFLKNISTAGFFEHSIIKFNTKNNSITTIFHRDIPFTFYNAYTFFPINNIVIFDIEINIIYYGFSDKYEITKKDTGGTILLKFGRKYKPPRVPNYIKRRIREFNLRLGEDVKIPKRMPCFRKMLIYDDKIFISLWDKDNQDKYAVDVFNTDGIFLKTEYYDFDFYDIRVIKNGYAYLLTRPHPERTQEIRRYKVVLGY